MTTAEAQAMHNQSPHISVETIAYYAGRNGSGCGFAEPVLIAAYKRGRRELLAEDRLDADPEWDGDGSAARRMIAAAGYR